MSKSQAAKAKFQAAKAIRAMNPLFIAKRRVLSAMIYAGTVAAKDITDEGLKRQVLKHVVRKIAETFPNTSKWCTSTMFVTKDALAILEANGMTVLDLTNSTKAKALGLVHEHGMPNSVFYEFALDLVERGGDVSELEEFLSNNFTVIATAAEGKLVDQQGISKMPAGWTYSDAPYARYERAGLLESLVFNTWFYKS